MLVKTLVDCGRFETVTISEHTERTISSVYCCDLLSIAMSKAPADCAWITVMGNINTLAVASLTDSACIILAEGSALDEAALARARQQDITVLRTELPVFETALEVYNRIHENTQL